MKVISFNMTPSSKFPKEEMDLLPTFDNTKLTAINTCPTWGLIRYEEHKTFSTGNSRAMALEAGSAAHESYAAIRLADLYLNGASWYPDLDVEEIAVVKMSQLFDDKSSVTKPMSSFLIDILEGSEDTERKILNVALERFSQSGYYEDPSDRRRTVANIEEALIAYVQRYPIGETMPIIIGDFVGVEIPLDICCEIDYTLDSGEIKSLRCRLTGRIDGLHYKNKTKQTILIEENKTASRIDEAWQTSFQLSHQVTGYCLGASALIGEPVTEGIIRGMAIPLPKSYDYGGIVNVPVKRHDFQFDDWIQWFVETFLIWEKHRKDAANAPKYTHSCNRYFRVCPMYPICLSPPDERAELLAEMRVEEWSPLENGNE